MRTQIEGVRLAWPIEVWQLFLRDRTRLAQYVAYDQIAAVNFRLRVQMNVEGTPVFGVAFTLQTKQRADYTLPCPFGEDPDPLTRAAEAVARVKLNKATR